MFFESGFDITSVLRVWFDITSVLRVWFGITSVLQEWLSMFVPLSATVESLSKRPATLSPLHV